MKNKEFYKLLKKNKSNSNSGFTLTELLVGLFMSIFVVGALGFGLMTILRATKSETSKIEVRNETSRALDFISDEVRRASTIETNATNVNNTDGFTITGKTVVLALDVPEVGGDSDPDGDGNLFGVDNDTNTSERIVYFLQSSTNTNWKGPLVLYRYGPPLDANGNYTDGDWGEEALIDGIDDTVIATNPCTVAGGTLSPTTARGFHACINGGNTAQLFLTGGTDTATGGSDTYTADTKVVARARTAPTDVISNFVSYTVSFKTLGATYNCNPGDGSTWKMRTDFGNDPTDTDATTSWIHQDNRQPQPIKIDTTKDLTITSVPVQPSASSCLSKGDETATGDSRTEPLSAYTDGTFPDGHTVPHIVKFSGTDYWHTFNGDPKTGTRDVPDVKGDGTVLVLKRGSVIASTLSGYDYDNNGTEDQDSLGKFLRDKGFADFTNGTDASGGYTINNKLGTDERIMAVEVGHTDRNQPGFDVQDSVFILSSDIFAKGHENP